MDFVVKLCYCHVLMSSMSLASRHLRNFLMVIKGSFALFAGAITKKRSCELYFIIEL